MLGLWLSVLAMIEIVVGFAGQSYIVATVENARTADAYFAAQTVPAFCLAVALAPLLSVAIPYLASSEEHDRTTATSNLVRVTGLGTLAIVVVLASSASLWVPWLLPGFSGKDLTLAILLARIQMLGLVPASLSVVLRAASYARKRFIIAEAFSVGGAAMALVALYVAVPRYGVEAAAWIYVARSCFTLAGLFTVNKIRWLAALEPRLLRPIWGQAKPLVVGALYFKSEPLVDQYLASQCQPGDLATLAFCRLVLTGGLQVVSQAVVAPLSPELALQAKQHRWADLRRTCGSRLRTMAIVTCGGLALFAILGRPLLDLVASHVQNRGISFEHIFVLLILLSGIPVGGGLGQIVATTFYAINETRRATIVGAIGFTIGLVLKIAGFHFFGIWGIAGATSIYFLLDAGLLGFTLRRLLDSTERKFSSSTAKQ